MTEKQPRQHHAWTAADFRTIRAMVAAHRSVREIAAHLGVSVGSLRTRMSLERIASGTPVGAHPLPIPPMPDGWVWGTTANPPRKGRSQRHVVMLATRRTACGPPAVLDVDMSMTPCAPCLAALRRMAREQGEADRD